MRLARVDGVSPGGRFRPVFRDPRLGDEQRLNADNSGDQGSAIALPEG